MSHGVLDRPALAVCYTCGKWRTVAPAGRIPTSCSTRCRMSLSRNGPKIPLPPPPPDTGTPAGEGHPATSEAVALHRAGRFRDMLAFVEKVSSDVSGCWVWPELSSNGYSWGSLYRKVLEAKEGAPLGSQAAHHMCANASCVNPGHLQPVTHRENTAEMLARKSLVARVRELEEELAAIDPGNSVLNRIPVI